MDFADISLFLGKINQELPDELVEFATSPQSILQQSSAAAQNGSDRRIDETIQKNRNLSELLSQETIIQRTVPGSMGMLRQQYNNAAYIRCPPGAQQMQQRQFALQSGNRAVIMPGNTAMPYTGMSGPVLQHVPRNNMVNYGQPRQLADFARMGNDNTNRPYGNPAVGSYFSNGPDVRSNVAVMNNATFQRTPGSYPTTASFSPGSGSFQVSNDFQSGNVFHAAGGGTMFPGMVNPDLARPFSPGVAVPGGGSFPMNSYTMNNMGTALSNRVPPCSVPAAAPVGSGTMQLVNGSYTSSVAHKPVSETDSAVSKNNSLVCQSSIVVTNCQRLQTSIPADGSGVVAKPAVMRINPLPPSKDNTVSMEASLVSVYPSILHPLL